ncbi:hypothetical protein BKH41_00010 [Helicobacter sp. 12S02232-10]|uniref:hypothetical protein n=1 Tax=Helicobacter sp. 12S02232-10 TaxID=1476197 RepID=UPI000BA553E9|nr:hypothetical protein [Helicobacter sp. 12S02232-10]PAF49735.1 hypothetical protein BKH41_00010 [Helicobacter sp. 12S02232-10]
MLLNNKNKNLIDHPMIRYLFRLMVVCLIALGVLNIAYGEKMGLKEAKMKYYDALIDDRNLFIPPRFRCPVPYQKTNDSLLQNRQGNEVIICNFNHLSFQDNFFSSLYKAIIKGNPNLKERAKKIVEAMLDERDNQCSVPAEAFVKNSNVLKTFQGGIDGVATAGCISGVYDDFIYQMVSFLYENDKTLFERIFGKDKFFSDFVEKYPTYKNYNRYDEEDSEMKEFYDEFKKTHNGFSCSIDFDCFYTLLVADDRLDIEHGRLNIVFEDEKDYVKAKQEYNAYAPYIKDIFVATADLSKLPKISPSFQCKIKDKNLKNITKAKDITTEDMICISNDLIYRDNLFSSLYQAIIKGNPKLKMEARNIAREMLRKRNGKCNFKRGDNFDWIAHIYHYCIFKAYSDYIFKLASFLYQNDQVLFNQIFKDTQKSPTPYYSEFFKNYLLYAEDSDDLENEKQIQAKKINDTFIEEFSTASMMNSFDHYSPDNYPVKAYLSDLYLSSDYIDNYSFIINLIADGLINPNGSLKAAGGLEKK